jgi:hypothetical protein
MAGLNINFDKSEVLMIGGDRDLALAYAEILIATQMSSL